MSAQAPTPLQGGPSSSLQGWRALTVVLAGRLPTAFKRAAAIRRAALRELR